MKPFLQKLDIQGYQTNISQNINLDKITNVVYKCKDHSSIVSIKEKLQESENFSFSYINKQTLPPS